MVQGNSQNVTLNEKTRQATLFTIILLHNIKMDGEGRRKRETERGDKQGQEGTRGKIKWKEVLAIVISLLKTVLRDFIANSKISSKML